MQLEDGKRYKNKLGHIVRVYLKRPGTDFPFDGDNAMSYMSDGRYIPEDDLPVSVYHLVEEYKE